MLRRWILRQFELERVFGHCIHLKGFSPVCVWICLWRLLE
jgi:hypothetical protein